jgi:Flp pilus assembly protein TadG
MGFVFSGGSFFYVPQGTDGSASKARVVMKRDATHRRGQGLVEFALVVPLFLVLLFGMVEFGRAWMTKNILTGAAREAVRRYAVIPYDNNVAASRAVDILSSAGLDSSRWTISIYSDPVDNNIMRADVTYNFPVFIVGFIPGLPTNNILLSTSTSMRRE